MIAKYFVLLVTIGAAASIKQVPVAIYYETLCEDSIAFITKEFTPTWRDLKDYIRLELVPYGKTTTETTTQGLTYHCHHGPNECDGNKFQGCLIDPIRNIPQNDQVDFIDCLMKDAKKDRNYTEAINSCHVKLPSVRLDLNLLNTCAFSDANSDVLRKNGEKTRMMQDPLASVPTIVFDGRFDKSASDEAVKSFRNALCKRITDSPKPKACEGSGAAITTTIGMMTLFISGLVVRMI